MGTCMRSVCASGLMKWKYHTGGERRFAAKHLHGVQPVNETMPDPFDCFLSSPAVWNGAGYFGSGDGNIYSVNAATGALNRKFKTGDVGHASPAIADGILFLGSWDSYFYALDAATGQQRWRFKTGGRNSVVGSGGGWDGLFRLSRFALICPRRSNRREEVGVSGNGSWVISSLQ
jgi:outer membrane protein assembly factor BamB